MHSPLRLIVIVMVGAAALLTTTVHADDWPEWRGAGREAVWTEDGILERFPAGALKVTWRTPIQGGFAGPVVADGRIFVMISSFSPRRR